MSDAPDFRVSSFCSGGACVSVADTGAEVLVANLATSESAVRFTYEEWLAFVAGVKVGEFDFG